MRATSSLAVAAFMVVVSVFAPAGQAQQTEAAVPRLVQFSGILTEAARKPVAGVTFALYKDQEGGAPVWMETQNVALDESGRYTVMLGSARSEGLPVDLFASGEARWLGIQAEGQREQPRVLLLSVPYALKAADAETVGGLPASAFVLTAAATASIANSNITRDTPADANSAVTQLALAGSGTLDFIPLWTPNGNTLGNSILFQSASSDIGIGTQTPAAKLDVKGGATIRGSLSLPARGTATTTAGTNSQPLNLTSSTFNSGTGSAVSQNFRWQVEPVGNNTGSAGSSLNLLFGSGATTPAETGLTIGSNGQITFAPGQTFPSSGTGTVTSVGLSAPGSDFTVTGSPVTTSGSLGLNWSAAPTSANIANAIVKRDVNGSFSAQTIFAAGVAASNSISSGGVVLGTVSGQLGAINLSAGVYGDATSNVNAGSGIGVYGTNETPNGTAVFGSTTGTNSFGVLGEGRGPDGLSVAVADGSPGFGGESQQFVGVAPMGVLGDSNGGIGVVAVSDFSQALVAETGPQSTSDTLVVINNGGGLPLYAAGTGGSMYLDASGNLHLSGVVYAAAKDFRVDHPLDPANKYLNHASVESSEMMNIYTGNVITDLQGAATVHLPEWFESLNTDFRYQLTAIGQFAQAIVAREIQDHQFLIKTSVPNVKVSWQVTCVRQDAFAKARPLVVEQEKEGNLRGYYINPELYGAPKDASMDSAHHLELMKRLKGRPVSPPAVKPVRQADVHSVFKPGAGASGNGSSRRPGGN